jgi:serine/arginine repetitive matrix protein 2
MYNGIGLTTPRGRFVHSSLLHLLYINSFITSGTNGYVIRNLSVVRSRDSASDRANAWDAAPPKHREPDKEILEHERKRKVEVKCLELQLELEDKE